MRHQRTVTWIREDVPRDAIDQDLRYSLGAFMTVCRIKLNNAEDRIKALLNGHAQPPTSTQPAEHLEAEAREASAPVDLGELARDQIRQRIAERFQGPRLRPPRRADP